MSALARLDFTTYSPRGRPGLLVEAKRVLKTSAMWAADWRRILFDYQPEGLNEVILALVTPEQIYVWPIGAVPDALPRYVMDTQQHLRGYFDRVKARPETISRESFERLVSWWLGDLTEPRHTAALPEHLRRELEDSGLLDALQDAQIVHEEESW